MFEPLGNRSFLLNPADTLERMRVNHPAYRYEKSATPIVNVFGYRDIRRLLRDVDTFSNTLTGAQEGKGATDPYNLLGMDPPHHKRMRDVVSGVFTPKIIDSLKANIRDNAQTIMRQVLDMETCDAVEDFGAPLAVHLICQLIGVPDEDKPLMREWTREASELGFDLLWHTDSNLDYESRIQQSMTTMHEYFGTAIDQRLANPKSDVLTQIATSGLSREESVSFARLLLVAGNETTTNLINHIIRLLIVYPEVNQQLRQNPELVDNMLAETLRFAPPIRGTFREARKDTEIAGVPVYRNEVVWAWIFSANRDPRLCEAPQEFRLNRTPPNHLAFGHGIHTCLGITLAKMEARVMLDTLLEQTSVIEPLSDDLVPLDSLLSNGFVSHPVRFIPS